jgi:hypothetical protein
MTEADKDHALLAVKASEAAVNATHLVALLRAGAIFINEKLVGRPGRTPSRSRLKDLDPQVLIIARLHARPSPAVRSSRVPPSQRAATASPPGKRVNPGERFT